LEKLGPRPVGGQGQKKEKALSSGSAKLLLDAELYKKKDQNTGITDGAGGEEYVTSDGGLRNTHTMGT